MHRCLPIPACHRPTAPSWRLAHSAPRTPRLASLQRGRGRASDRVPVTRHSLLACACELVCRRTAASHQGPRCFCELSSQQSLQVRQVRCECAGPRCRPVANCSPAAPAVRCTGPYHLSMYVCMCVQRCWIPPAKNVDGWLSSPEHEDAWVRPAGKGATKNNVRVCGVRPWRRRPTALAAAALFVCQVHFCT